MAEKRAGGFEDAMQLEQPVRHHREIGHHVVFAQKAAQGFHHFRHVGIRLVQQFIKFALGLLTPMPCVLKCFNVRLAFMSARRFEKNCVIAFGIKRRIEINEVNGCVRNVLAEDLEIIAVIELVHRAKVCAGKLAASISVSATKAAGGRCGKIERLCFPEENTGIFGVVGLPTGGNPSRIQF
jgi:hypothetical protein